MCAYRHIHTNTHTVMHGHTPFPEPVQSNYRRSPKSCYIKMRKGLRPWKEGGQEWIDMQVANRPFKHHHAWAHAAANVSVVAGASSWTPLVIICVPVLSVPDQNVFDLSGLQRFWKVEVGWNLSLLCISTYEPERLSNLSLRLEWTDLDFCCY